MLLNRISKELIDWSINECIQLDKLYDFKKLHLLLDFKALCDKPGMEDTATPNNNFSQKYNSFVHN